jgi:calcium-dependent protein kinase
MGAGEALEHGWFKTKTSGSGSDVKISGQVLQRLASFRGTSKLKKAAMNMLVKMADQSTIEDLRLQFVALDKDKSGMINADELKLALKQSSVDIPEQNVDKIIDEVDYFGNGKINYTEFLVATLDVKSFLDRTKLEAIFN